MPIHDRSHVVATLCCNLQLSRDSELSARFNTGGLPTSYDPLTEHHKVAFGFEFPAIGRNGEGEELSDVDPRWQRFEKMLSEPWPDPPVARIVAEDEWERYRRGHRTVTVRRETDDAVVAVIERPFAHSQSFNFRQPAGRPASPRTPKGRGPGPRARDRFAIEDDPQASGSPASRFDRGRPLRLPDGEAAVVGCLAVWATGTTPPSRAGGDRSRRDDANSTMRPRGGVR